MNSEKEFNKKSEAELERVSGGRTDGIKLHYRCPVCGREKWETPRSGAVARPVCGFCSLELRKSVTMETLPD